MTADEIEEQKSIEFYAAGVNAWYNTSLEHDKSVFALSAGGIGLLITLMTTVGPTSSVVLCFYIAAILCFLVSLICILIIFRQNKTHIEQVLTSNNVASDPVLRNLDLVALATFGIGAAFAALVGISAAVSSFENKEKAVAIENESQNSTPTPALESFSGVQKLQPQTDFTKSFNGIGNLQPQVVPAPAAPTAPVASVPSPAPAATNSSSAKQGS